MRVTTATSLEKERRFCSVIRWRATCLLDSSSCQCRSCRQFQHREESLIGTDSRWACPPYRLDSDVADPYQLGTTLGLPTVRREYVNKNRTCVMRTLLYRRQFLTLSVKSCMKYTCHIPRAQRYYVKTVSMC